MGLLTVLTHRPLGVLHHHPTSCVMGVSQCYNLRVWSAYQFAWVSYLSKYIYHLIRGRLVLAETRMITTNIENWIYFLFFCFCLIFCITVRQRKERRVSIFVSDFIEPMLSVENRQIEHVTLLRLKCTRAIGGNIVA